QDEQRAEHELVGGPNAAQQGADGGTGPSGGIGGGHVASVGVRPLRGSQGLHLALKDTHMTRFRPCIDLHDGRVKQIVGGTLRDDAVGLCTNFESEHPAEWFAARYRDDALTGGHVIKLGPGNDDAARAALAAYPGGLQLGGGITAENAGVWLEAGASQVIVTSWLFDSTGHFLAERLDALVNVVGRERLVIDLSCRSD